MGFFDSMKSQGAPQAQQMNVAQQIEQLKRNPVQMLQKAGYSVPQNIASNPQAMVQHLLQTGQISSPALQKVQQYMGMLKR